MQLCYFVLPFFAKFFWSYNIYKTPLAQQPHQNTLAEGFCLYCIAAVLVLAKSLIQLAQYTRTAVETLCPAGIGLIGDL